MREQPFESLNMVPFIDIMLVLLTIVLTTSTFVASGRIPVRLPQATQRPSTALPIRTIDIDATGQAWLDGQSMPPAMLRERLASLSREQPLLLRADQSVTLQHFVDVADVLQQLGFLKVAVQTDARQR